MHVHPTYHYTKLLTWEAVGNCGESLAVELKYKLLRFKFAALQYWQRGSKNLLAMQTTPSSGSCQGSSV